MTMQNLNAALPSLTTQALQSGEAELWLRKVITKLSGIKNGHVRSSKDEAMADGVPVIDDFGTDLDLDFSNMVTAGIGTGLTALFLLESRRVRPKLEQALALWHTYNQEKTQDPEDAHKRAIEGLFEMGMITKETNNTNPLSPKNIKALDQFMQLPVIERAKIFVKKSASFKRRLKHIADNIKGLPAATVGMFKGVHVAGQLIGNGLLGKHGVGLKARVALELNKSNFDEDTWEKYQKYRSFRRLKRNNMVLKTAFAGTSVIMVLQSANGVAELYQTLGHGFNAIAHNQKDFATALTTLLHAKSFLTAAWCVVMSAGPIHDAGRMLAAQKQELESSEFQETKQELKKLALA